MRHVRHKFASLLGLCLWAIRDCTIRCPSRSSLGQCSLAEASTAKTLPSPIHLILDPLRVY